MEVRTKLYDLDIADNIALFFSTKQHIQDKRERRPDVQDWE